MIYTPPFIMFLMRADPLREQVGGGWTLEKEIETFLCPEMATSEAKCGKKKLLHCAHNAVNFPYRTTPPPPHLYTALNIPSAVNLNHKT
jgi:hypothetical protein